MVKVKKMKPLEFEKRISTESVICFCAGQGLRDLCEVYPVLVDRVSYVVDNYCYGKKISMGIREIPVISMKEIKADVREKLLVITSVQYADEIIKQLDDLKVCDNLVVYVPALFWGNDSKTKLFFHGEEIIPRKIHYCWFGKGDMPDKFQRNIESWKKLCPSYEIVRWDESNYDYKKNKYMLEAYEAKRWGFVPDYARLDIINRYGGIYLDTDVELVKPLDDFLQFKLYCGFENTWFVAFGLGFGGVADSSVLREMMELYDRMEFKRADGSLNLTASPVYQTKVLTEHGLVRNGCCQKNDEFAVFSTEYFSPFNAYGIGEISANTYSIHQYAATWFGEKQKEAKNRTEKSVKFVMERI